MNANSDTIIRSLALGIALVNQLLTSVGKNPLPVSEEEAYTTFSAIFTLGTSVWAWWKNNSFTENAIKADEYLEELKQE